MFIPADRAPSFRIGRDGIMRVGRASRWWWPWWRRCGLAVAPSRAGAVDVLPISVVSSTIGSEYLGFRREVFGTANPPTVQTRV